MHFADDDKERGIQLHGRYQTGSTPGSNMCLVSLCRTEKSLWEHHNEIVAKLDEKQETAWNDMANTILVFVRLPSSHSTPPLRLKSK